MANAKRILIIDDDERLLRSLQTLLEPNGFEVLTLTGGEGAAEVIHNHNPDIILLDVMMEGEDGFSTLQRLRASFSIPVIMLTARGEDTDRIVGLEMGADDYLAKPFNPRELLARIKAVLRRNEGGMARKQEYSAPPSYAAFRGDYIELDGYSLDARRQVLSRQGKPVKLSTAEFYVLFTLMTHPGQILARDQLLMLAFSRDDYSSDRNIDVYISRLRRVLQKLGDSAERIRTVWGTGYCWVNGGDNAA